MRSEFDLIQNLKSKYSLDRVGDDCAVLPNNAETDLVVTADMLVENIDFRIDRTTPEFIGHKALAVSLSDVGAMGARPVWAMLSIAVPDDLWSTDFVDRFYEGWFKLAAEHGVELVGGDISRSPGKLVIDSIVGGEVPKGRAVLRSGAKPGDLIYVSGSLGGAAGGLRLIENGVDYADNSQALLLKQLQPQPQLAAAKQLQDQNIATSMIDISDGLSSDLAHICETSGVGARIYADWLPINVELKRSFTADECLDMALNGGEDFELLFTVAEKNISRLPSGDFTRIGEITANIGIIELNDAEKASILQPKGYRHF